MMQLKRRLTSILGLALAANACQLFAAGEGVPWVDDIATARTHAASGNQLVLVHFWSSNCPPCARLERQVFSQPIVGHSITQQYVPVKVNVDHYPAIAKQFGVDRWPSDVVLTPEGMILHRTTSPPDATNYVNMLRQVAWRHTYQPETTQYAATTPSQPDPQDFSKIPMASGLQSSIASAHTRYPSMAATANPRSTVVTQNRPGQQNTPQATNARGGPGSLTGPARPVAHVAPQMIDNQYFANAPGSGRPSPANSALSASTPPNASPPQSPPPAGRVEVVTGKPAFQQAPAMIHNTYTQPREQRAASNPAAQPVTSPEIRLGLDGFCPVTLVVENSWQLGDKRWGVRHRGRVYLFLNPAAQQAFLADPDRYCPALAGYDPVVFAEQGSYTDGFRQHGLRVYDQIYLFSSEQSLDRFSQDPSKYVDPARQAMAATSPLR